MELKSFAGYSSLCWHLQSLGACKTSVQSLLAFRVSIKKSDVILNVNVLNGSCSVVVKQNLQ